MFQRPVCRATLAPLAVLVAACSAAAAPRPNIVQGADGYRWATIGAPGNRPTLPHEVPTRPDRVAGAVNYEYRMATTEVTVGEWFDFVRAYAPYVGSDFGNSHFRSSGIQFVGFDAGVPQYWMNPAHAGSAADMSWRYAARYCNWLHNGRPTGAAVTLDAFQRGAYDAATFTTNPDNTVNDQSTRSEGARYWIPSADEWTKAVYYDPDRHGPGQGGYWRYPGGQDTPLQGGYPHEPGAQTSAPLTVGPGYFIAVGSYPHVQAPWGLLDASGGVSEWTETFADGSTLFGRREIRGAYAYSGEFSYLSDRIEEYGTGGTATGLRLASPVPSAWTVAVCPVGVLLLSRRRPWCSRA